MMYSLLSGFCVIAAVAIGYWAGAKHLLPVMVPDVGNITIATKEPKAWLVGVELFEKLGAPPVRESSTRFASRAFLAGGIPIIMNCTDPEGLRQMGNPNYGFAFVVKNPLMSAIWAADFLKEKGYRAEVLSDIEPDVPEGALVFLRCEEVFPGLAIVFRKHAFRMGPPPRRWDWGMHHRFGNAV